MISRTAGYALRAVLYIAQNEGEGPVRVNDMAAALDLPRNYLSKTLHLLARARVLTSTRGKLGGFELAVPSATLSLFQVVVAFDDLDTRRCLLGVRECSDRTACAARALETTPDRRYGFSSEYDHRGARERPAALGVESPAYRYQRPIRTNSVPSGERVITVIRQRGSRFPPARSWPSSRKSCRRGCTSSSRVKTAGSPSDTSPTATALTSRRIDRVNR